MTGRDVRAVGLFTVLAFGLAWLVALPLWLGDGLASRWLPALAVVMMTTPAIATLIVVRFVERPERITRTLGLWPLQPIRPLVTYAILGVLGAIAVVLVALPIGALLGVYPADLTGFSAFRQVLDQQLAASGKSDLPIPIGALVALQLATMPLAAGINLGPALGEELGWRGWLLPNLMPLGPIPAILISGVLWGAWHAPLILLGYNYPGVPGWLGVSAMIAMCILIGALFGWLRLRSGSVWPAALAHAAFNGAAGSYLLFAAAGETVDTTQATVLGWSGWIVPLLLVVTLVATGRFTPAPGDTVTSPPADALR